MMAKRQKMTEVLKVKKLSENATLPYRASSKAAGYDLSR
jgi:dUTPase